MMFIGKQKFFGFFFIVMAIDAVFFPLTSITKSSLGFDFLSQYPKIPLLLLFFTAFLYALLYGIKCNFITLTFFLATPVYFLYGVLSNGMTYIVFSHLYGALMPFVCVSFGQSYVCYASENTKNKVITNFKKIFPLFFVIIVLYFCLYISGVITYFGMGTYVGYFVALFASLNSVGMSFFSLLLTLLTGKRAILVAGGMIFLIYLVFSRSNSKSKSLSLFKVLIFITIPLFVFIAASSGLLDRFSAIMNVDFNDPYSLYVATGGRSWEISNLIEHLNNSGNWLFGGGFGETFTGAYSLTSDLQWTLHYSHMSPLYFVLVYGTPFAAIMYGYFTLILLNGVLSRSRSFYFLTYALLLITSFAGSIIFVDPKFWFFLGACIGMQKYNKSMLLN